MEASKEVETREDGDLEGEERKGAKEEPWPGSACLRTRAPPRQGLRWARVGAGARSCCVMQAPAGLIGSLGTAVRAWEGLRTLTARAKPRGLGEAPCDSAYHPLKAFGFRRAGPNALTGPGGRGLWAT